MDKFAKASEEISNPSLQPDGNTPTSRRPGVSTHLKPGYLIDGRFKVEYLIASGGFGSVYMVRHILMNKIMALKTLDPIVASETTKLRLQRESQAVAKLNHPNIVHASDFGLIDGLVPFMVMEFVEGPTLAEHLKRCTTLSVDAALQIFIPVCKALAYAHEQGIVHRDIKPSNIILTRDERDPSRFIPKLVDFGIAKLTCDEHTNMLTLTQTGELFGTPLYMSPEQCAGTTVDNRSDIYALGCVMFESLTGAPPFRGNSALETMMQHATSEAPPLKQASLGIEFPSALDKLVAKMLAKDTHRRYQSCNDVANDMYLLKKGDVDKMQVARAAPISIKVIRPIQRADFGLVVLGSVFGIIFGALLMALVCNNYWIPTAIKSRNEDIAKQQLEDRPSPVQIALDTGYFRGAEGSAFNFPQLIYLGDMKWWTKTAHGQAKAVGDVTSIPAGASIVLTASDPLIATPYYWGHFKPTDLTGIVLAAQSTKGFRPETDDMDTTTVDALQQLKLHYFKLENMQISRRTFNMIGDVPDLKWLWIKRDAISNVKTGQARSIDGADIGSLKNIRNLDTLVITEFKNVLPVLTALNGSKIRRLKISSHVLTAEEISALRQLRSLEVIDLMGAKKFTEVLDALQSLPNLKRISLAYCDVHPFEKGTTTYHFPKLEVFSLNQECRPQFLGMARTLFRKHFQVPDSFDWNRDLLVGSRSSDDWFQIEQE
jgi:tRNA A-37 threonylcarbamoyl transferase component Bud32